jgi:hypothetical protein
VSGAAAVALVAVLLTLCGLGALAILGVARSRSELAYRAGLAPLAGIAWAGIAGATLATAGTRLSLAGLVVLTAATCAGGALRILRRATVPEPSEPVRRSRLELTLVVVALASIAALCVAALAAFHDKPVAEYDGWAIWATKAKAIAVLGSADPAVFAGEAYERLHLEYPLLVPAVHALPLQALDHYSSPAIILQCLVIGAAGLLALWALLRDRVRPVLLLAFLAATLAMPAFLVQLGTGYADVPLALFIAVGLAAAARWLVDDGAPWLALTTLFFAAAALTKNEGLLFAASTYVPLLLVASGRRRAVGLSAAVVALLYAPWRAYTAFHHLETPDYDLSSSFDVSWVAGRLDRGPPAARALLGEALELRQYGLLLFLGVCAAALALAFGPRSLGVLAAGFALLSLAGLSWIYVLTPYDLAFYLSTNKDRIVMSLVVGLAALAPLLVEETVRAVSARRRE